MRVLIPMLALLAGCGLAPHAVDATDPRLQACGGRADSAIAAFPLRADQYRDHFPGMGKSPELEVEAEAFAVVFDLDHQPAMMGGPLLAHDAAAAPPPQPTGHFVCIYVGAPGQGDINLYGDVDIAWMGP